MDEEVEEKVGENQSSEDWIEFCGSTREFFLRILCATGRMRSFVTKFLAECAHVRYWIQGIRSRASLLGIGFIPFRNSENSFSDFRPIFSSQ